jgi:hypothetical protein
MVGQRTGRFEERAIFHRHALKIPPVISLSLFRDSWNRLPPLRFSC